MYMSETERSTEQQSVKDRVVKEERLSIWQFGFEQGILKYLRLGERGSFGSIAIDGEVTTGWVNQSRPLEQQTVQAVKSGTPEELERFDDLVRGVRNLLFDQRRRDTVLRKGE